MKSAHSKILVGDASGVRAPYAVRSPLRAGPKWKFESISFIQVGRQPNRHMNSGDTNSGDTILNYAAASASSSLGSNGVAVCYQLNGVIRRGPSLGTASARVGASVGISGAIFRGGWMPLLALTFLEQDERLHARKRPERAGGRRRWQKGRLETCACAPFDAFALPQQSDLSLLNLQQFLKVTARPGREVAHDRRLDVDSLLHVKMGALSAPSPWSARYIAQWSQRWSPQTAGTFRRDLTLPWAEGAVKAGPA